MTSCENISNRATTTTTRIRQLSSALCAKKSCYFPSCLGCIPCLALSTTIHSPQEKGEEGLPSDFPGFRIEGSCPKVSQSNLKLCIPTNPFAVCLSLVGNGYISQVRNDGCYSFSSADQLIDSYHN